MRQIILLLLIILITTSCISKECRDAEDVKLRLLVDYSPLVDTFSIGDTLTIFSEFSDMIEDSQSGDIFHIEDFKFYSLILIRKFENGLSIGIDTQEDQIVNTNIDYDLTNYTINEGTGINIDKHNYENNKYNFHLGFVFRKSGLYVIGVDSFLGFSNATDNQRFEGQCPGQKLEAGGFHRPPNSNPEDYNFPFIEGIQLLENTSEEEFKTQALYAFYVKE